MSAAVESVVTIADPDDPRLADYRDLTDAALRRRVEPEHGVFIAEGELVVRRAVRAGYPVRSLLVADARLPLAADLAGLVAGAPVYAGSPAVLERVTGFHVHRGLLAAMARLPVPPWRSAVAAARRVVVLEDLSNPTNLGAVVRSAAGLGMDAVLLSPTCGDPLYRRAVRTSMGEVFAVPYARLTPWPSGLADLADLGFRVLALTPDPDAVPLDRLAVAADDRLAVLLGAEGPGLSSPALAVASEWVRIPMAAGVDSLNVAAAAAVACYVLGGR